MKHSANAVLSAEYPTGSNQDLVTLTPLQIAQEKQHGYISKILFQYEKMLEKNSDQVAVHRLGICGKISNSPDTQQCTWLRPTSC